MGTCPGILGNARACLVGHLGRKMLSQAKTNAQSSLVKQSPSLNAKEKEEIGKKSIWSYEERKKEEEDEK